MPQLTPLARRARARACATAVEVQEEDDERDDGWEVTYMQNKGRGMMRLRVNASQMDEKLLALDALWLSAWVSGHVVAVDDKGAKSAVSINHCDPVRGAFDGGTGKYTMV